MDNKAQISAELMIVMAAILAIAILFINSLRSSSNTASKKLADTGKKAIREISKIR